MIDTAPAACGVAFGDKQCGSLHCQDLPLSGVQAGPLLVEADRRRCGMWPNCDWNVRTKTNRNLGHRLQTGAAGIEVAGDCKNGRYESIYQGNMTR